MENRLLKTKRKRFLAFIFDMMFIMFLAFSINGLLGIVFKLDSEIYQNAMVYIVFVITLPYMFLGELILKNTLGKYLFGIEVVSNNDFERPSVGSFIKRGLLKVIWPVEGLVLLFMKSKKRLGDLWGKTIVVNKETNQYKPLVRAVIGVATLIVLYFSTSTFMGLGVKNTDFYAVGVDYLKNTQNLEVDGLTVEVNQNGELVSFIVPVIVDDEEQYALLCLERIEGDWTVYHQEFLYDHSGRNFNFTLSSSIKTEHHENGQISFEGGVIEDNKEGTCTWFHDNGQVRELTVWHNNLLTGKVLMYYSNGTQSAEGTAVNGMKEGKATLWHENGEISESLYYSDDMISGDYISYHPNGQIHEKGIFENSIRVGDWEKYDDNGVELKE